MTKYDEDYDKIFKFHIRKCQKFCKGVFGLDKARKVYEYFCTETIHPHPLYTYEREMMNRKNDKSFPTLLMHEMAALVAQNEAA